MWVYAHNGQKVGPVTFEEIVNQIQAGVIVPNTPVCSSGEKPCRAGHHPKLQPIFASMNKPSENTSSGSQEASTPNAAAGSENQSSAFPQFPLTNSSSKHTSHKHKNTKHRTVKKGKTPFSRMQILIMACIAVPVALILLFMVCRPSPEALYEKGKNYEFGRGVTRSYDKAFECWKKAAKRGNAKAQYEIGKHYTMGGLNQDLLAAAIWLRKSAEQGCADAQYELASLYKSYTSSIKDGVPNHTEEAIKWYRKAAEQGHIEAAYRLACCYDYGDIVAKDKAEAIRLYRIVAENEDHWDKYTRSSCQYNLGKLYYIGDGVPQDFKEAVKWFRKAAEQGHAAAQYEFGECYYKGKGVPKDKYEAVKWYGYAAKKNNADAMVALGIFYSCGECVEKDLNKAVELWRKAKEKGNGDAAFLLRQLEKGL